MQLPCKNYSVSKYMQFRTFPNIYLFACIKNMCAKKPVFTLGINNAYAPTLPHL